MKKTSWLFLFVFVLFGVNNVLLAQKKQPKLLVHLEIRDKKPIWSPDGKKIAFLYNINNISYLYVINDDGTNIEELMALDNIRCVNRFCWSPDGKKIAVAKKDIYVLDINGAAEPQNLTNENDDTQKYEQLCWSPDGKKIAFVNIKKQEQNAEIWIIATNGEFWYKLLKGLNPSWSPDSKQIAFQNGKNQRLYIITADGKSQQEIADGTGVSISNINWSPNADKLFFSFLTLREQGYIFAAKTDGSIVWNFTNANKYDVRNPVLSSDGNFIAFVQNNEIAKMDLTKHSNKTQKDGVYDGAYRGVPIFQQRNSEKHREVQLMVYNLTKTPGVAKSNPCWSPDGKKIAFICNGEVWRMNSNGSGQAQLTFKGTKSIEKARNRQKEKLDAENKIFRKVFE